MCVDKPVTFTLDNSVLLFSGAWRVEIISPRASDLIPLPEIPRGRSGPSALPSICQYGTVISSAYPISADDDRKWKVSIAVGIFSQSEKRWKTFGGYNQVHVTSLSPDCSRVAFIADEGAIHHESRAVFLLELGNGKITRLKEVEATWVSWSPDGKRLVIGTSEGNSPPKVELFDINSGEIRELASGSFPTWSPDGNWIAYVDRSGRKIRLIHPDATSDHSVTEVKASDENKFGFAPVWSPDGAKLLLNFYSGGNLDVRDVLLLDLVTGKSTRKSHNGDPVFGWMRLE
jgi:hypothetical protein